MAYDLRHTTYCRMGLRNWPITVEYKENNRLWSVNFLRLRLKKLTTQLKKLKPLKSHYRCRFTKINKNRYGYVIVFDAANVWQDDFATTKSSHYVNRRIRRNHGALQYCFNALVFRPNRRCIKKRGTIKATRADIYGHCVLRSQWHDLIKARHDAKLHNGTRFLCKRIWYGITYIVSYEIFHVA